MRRYRTKQKPRLEALESRVMLSVGDNPANVAGNHVDWSTVIHTTGTETPLVEVFFNDQGMRITGVTGAGNVTIDLSQLPASVANLQISSFESVTLTGEATLHDLVVSDVKTVDAGHVNAERLFAFGAERVRIDNAPVEVWLEGAKDAEGHATIGAKTLFATDHFSTAPDAFIFGLVNSLGLMTTSHVENQLQVFNGSPDQPVLLNFKPDAAPKIAGLAQANTIEGDFATYFFSNRTEQVQLEKSSVVTARAALVQGISTQQFLGNPRLQAMLSDGADGGAKVAVAVTHPQLDPSITLARTDVAIRTSVEKVVETSHTATTVDISGLQLATPAPDASATTDHDSRAMHVASPEAVAPVGEISVAPARQTNPQSETVLSALSLALARLSEPFIQTVSDLQGRSATFGQIVSAQLTDRLRTDGRPVLLVDARPAATAKTRSADEVIVVHV